jgi:hypothetical protein
MHKDTKFDYEHFLNNLDVKPYDIVSEYKLGRALMAGRAKQIMDVLSELEPADFYDRYIQVMYNTVKEDFEKGNSLEGLLHYAYVANTYRDRFDNVPINVYNGNEISELSSFGNLKRLPDEEEIKVCIRMVKNKKSMRDMIHELFLAVDMCRHVDDGIEAAYDFLRANIAKHDSMLKGNGEVPKLDFVEGMLSHVMECNDPATRQQNTINMPSNRPDPADLPEAERINALHEAGKDSELPYKGMMLTTVVAEAARMLRLKDGPDAFDMELSGLRVGPVAFVGIPGEPFAGIGLGLKENKNFSVVRPT